MFINTNNNRQYVAISIKHTHDGWQYGKPCILWGYKRTDEHEKRCFAGYTYYLKQAELYSPAEFAEHGYSSDIVKPEPVLIIKDFCKRYRDYDTVLVDEREYKEYCKINLLAVEPQNY